MKQSAKEIGKWKSDEIESWDDEKVKNLIFEQGISTSDTVDLASGRGVGMDIIRDKVQSRNGIININSEQGQYLEFEITLPVLS